METLDKSLKYVLGNVNKNNEMVEIITSLKIIKIKNFNKKDTIKFKKSVNVFAEDYITTDFTKGLYHIYNVETCLLLSKDDLTKNDVIDMEFIYSGYAVCPGWDSTFGFFDDDIFDIIKRDDDDTPVFKDEMYIGTEKGKSLFMSDLSNEWNEFIKKRIENPKIGYIMNTNCGSAFPPLLCMRNERNLLLLDAITIEKIFK